MARRVEGDGGGGRGFNLEKFARRLFDEMGLCSPHGECAGHDDDLTNNEQWEVMMIILLSKWKGIAWLED